MERREGSAHMNKPGERDKKIARPAVQGCGLGFIKVMKLKMNYKQAA
jgi:hypothetical protein